MTIHFQLFDPSQMGNLYSTTQKNQQLKTADANSVATQLDDLKKNTKSEGYAKNYQKAYVVIFFAYIYIYIYNYTCIFIYTWCFVFVCKYLFPQLKWV